LADSLPEITDALVREVRRLRFGPPVAHVYNPLIYARAVHDEYVRKWGQGRREVVLVGMNPGPFGMAQTGVPFGEVALVREWLRLDGPIHPPREQHPKRPITGFACHRSEVSGARLWGWARERFGTPERFFRRFFVWNHCPLCFVGATGANITPDKLPAAEREPLFAACDRALRRVAEHFAPRFVVGVGNFAEARARAALEGMDVALGRIPHPSPASPAANRGWAAQAEKALGALGIRI
jgi:single-strand selective monofunctional uracil DNA glycosylase